MSQSSVFCSPADQGHLIQFILDHVIFLAVQKYASNVVEKCLNLATPQQQIETMNQICYRDGLWVQILSNINHFPLKSAHWKYKIFLIVCPQMVEKILHWNVCQLCGTEIDRYSHSSTVGITAWKYCTILQWDGTSCLWPKSDRQTWRTSRSSTPEWIASPIPIPRYGSFGHLKINSVDEFIYAVQSA